MKKGFLLVIALALLFQAAAAKQVIVSYNFPLGSGTADIEENIALPDDANAFSAFVALANTKSLALDISYFDFDGDGAKESAFINSVNGIGTSNDYSKYWQFSINNRPAMVGVSSFTPQENDAVSLDYFDGAKEDAMEWLHDKQKTNGEFGNNIFQDSFGIMGLVSADTNQAGYFATAINNAANFLLSQQQEDAGFGNDLYTATATMALLSSGKDLNDFSASGRTSIGLLKENQQNDGGFKSGSSASDVDTTAWATMAIAQAGEQLPEKNSKSPIDFLLSAQHENGSFGYNAFDATESIDFTEEAIIALSATAMQKDSNISRALEWLSSKQNPEGCFSDGFRTALGSIAFRSFEEDEKADKVANCLKTLQNGDGSFGRGTNTANAIDTGIAVIALGSAKIPLEILQSNGSDGNSALGINTIVKFKVGIRNNSGIRAQNVKVSLSGIPADWIYADEEGSTSSFAEIKGGETRTAEIFAKLKNKGSFFAVASVTTEQSSGETKSNYLQINVEEAIFEVSLSVE